MPEFIIVNGKRQYRPGIPGTIDASALGGKGIATGVMAVVGVLPGFEPRNPQTFTSARNLRAYDQADPALALLGKLAFAPGAQEGVNGCEALVVVNAQTCTQAQRTFLDGGGDSAFTVKSKVWGTAGNRTYLQVTNATAVGGVEKFVVSRDGLSETYEDIDSGVMATVEHGSAAFGAEMNLTRTEHYLTQDGIVGAYAATAFVPTPGILALIAVNGQIIVKPSAGSASDIIFTIEGLDETGTAATETLTWTGGGGFGLKTTVGTWTSVTALTGSTADAAYVGSISLSFRSLTVDPRNLNSFADFVDLVNNLGGGWTAEAASPNLSTVPADEVDCGVFPVSLGAPGTDVYAQLWAFVRTLGNSRLVEVARTTLADSPLVTASFAGHLLGGAVTSPVTVQNWTDAFETLLEEDVQVVVPLSNDVAVHQALRTHCQDAAEAETERCGWVGASASQSLVNLRSNWTTKLNTRHVALVGQSIEVVHPVLNRVVELEPYWYALMHGAAQCGTPVATPLTRKRLDVVDVLQDWSPKLDLDEAIRYGICATDYDNIGWRIARDVTTYLTDDNPVFSQVSSNESVNTSIRALRALVDRLIGTPNSTVSAAGLKSLVQNALAQQVQDGIIRAWRNVTITDLGTRFDVAYEAAPVEPVLWIPITLTAVRIAI